MFQIQFGIRHTLFDPPSAATLPTPRGQYVVGEIKMPFCGGAGGSLDESVNDLQPVPSHPGCEQGCKRLNGSNSR